MLTEKDVYAAAWKLWLHGEYPTPPKVREITGKGSFTTICKFLGKWFDSEIKDTSKNPHYTYIKTADERSAELHAECGRLMTENHRLKYRLKIMREKLGYDPLEVDPLNPGF
ncbi:DNA-binding protein [Sansalvadorimonas verongulae]|uniref:DNA-binding protein n=1 Tax=Sansalvadorimonas verongulae TaxID=2172824 RepID=UPI0012BD36F4|nr:DNA-binding protein [Sansalvadorimonas verongulae]MTI12259.1 hypothetical protein [Sansalvadorimonas verongulae]